MSTLVTTLVEPATSIKGGAGSAFISQGEAEIEERLSGMKTIRDIVMKLRPKNVGFVELEMSLYCCNGLIIPYTIRAYYARGHQGGDEFVSDLEVMDQRLDADRRIELRFYQDGSTSFTHDASIHVSELRQIAEKLQIGPGVMR